jgi:hypothetical protein
VLRSLCAAWQARRAAGNLSVSLLGDEDLAFWTRTLWRDETAMRAFMLSGAHRGAMQRLPAWCDEAAVAHWHHDALEPPSWAECHRRLREQGRASKVSFPSPAQMRLEIPLPRTRAELRFR